MTNRPNHGLFHSNQFLVVLRQKRSQVKRSLLAMGSHEFPVKSAKSNLQKTKGFGTDTVNQFGGYSEKASTNTFLPTKFSHVHLRRNKRPSKKIQLGSSFAKVFRKESCPKSATVGHRFHRFPVGQKKVEGRLFGRMRVHNHLFMPIFTVKQLSDPILNPTRCISQLK